MNHNINIDIGHRLKEWIKSKKLRQKDVASMLGISVVHMSNIVSGKQFLGQSLQIRLTELGADIGWILTGRRSNIEVNNLHHPLNADFMIPDSKEDVKDEIINHLEQEVKMLREQVDDYRTRVRQLTQNIVLVTNAAATPPEEE